MRGETVIHRKYIPGGVDKDGFKTPASWKETTIKGVGVDMGRSVEPKDGTVQRVIADATLFLPKGFTCDSKDEFIVRGQRFVVFGAAPALNSMFTGHAFRTEVPVKSFV